MSNKGSPRTVLRGRFSGCTFTRCKHPDSFPISHVRKVYFEGLFFVYALVVMPNRRNQYKFSTQHQLYFWEHRWILVQLLISADWFWHSNSRVWGSKYILNRLGCKIWRPKAVIDKKCSHYIIGYIRDLGPIFFTLSLVLNLYSICRIWSVYM